MFVYDEQDATLPHLPILRQHGVDLAEIPLSGHWPMYANPVAMWSQIAVLYDRHIGRG